MKINVKVKADILKTHPELCSWQCSYASPMGVCLLWHKKLTWITLSGRKEMLKRCRQCLANVIRG